MATNTYEQTFAQITPLNLERIRSNAMLTFLRERYAKAPNAIDGAEILRLEVEIMELDVQLRPLFAQLRAQQTQYWVYYEGECNVAGSTQTYWETCAETLWFSTACQVDTTLAGFTSTPIFEQLFREICEFIYHQRFTNFRIKGVKTLP